MNVFINAFNILFYQPLFNFLILLYQYLPGHDFGVAVIVLTIIVKIILYPLGTKAIRSQKNLSDLQPKLKEIQEKHKNDKEKQVKETMELYKKEKINPLSGCLPLLIQFPVLIALYRVFLSGLKPEQLSSFLYSFVPSVQSIRPTFLGLIDLSCSWFREVEGVKYYLWPNIILIILVGLFQFLQIKMLSPKTKPAKTSDFSNLIQKQMQYFTPIFIVLILLKVPSAVGLYLLTSALFSIVQQYFVFGRKLVKND